MSGRWIYFCIFVMKTRRWRSQISEKTSAYT